MRYQGGKNGYIVMGEHVYKDEIQDGDINIIKNFLDFGDKHINNLLGQEVDFYGAESQAFKVNDMVIEVLEDEDDGYRSYLGGYLATDESKYNFYSQPFAKVKLEEYNEDREINDYERHEFTGFRLVDVDDGHVWLMFGTDRSSDYYPRFVFSCSPKMK